MPSTIELAQLDAIRIDRDWTFHELAAAMSKADAPIPARTLYYLIKTPNAHPLDRTLHKVKKFIAHVKRHPGRPRKNRGH